MGAPERSATELGSAIRHARTRAGWTYVELAGEVAKVREARRLPVIEPESIRRQLVGFESGHHRPGPQWRSLLAEALRLSPEQLFGLTVDAELPRPLLLDTIVTDQVVQVIIDQREVHARAESIFGPVYARELVDRDLITIEQLIRVTPPTLRREAAEPPP